MSDATYKIVMWNVLTKAFAHRNDFGDGYTDETFDEKLRARLITNKVLTAMKEYSIIVLHEVDTDLHNLLTILAVTNKYWIHGQRHGNEKNEYMGTFILFPLDKWIVEKVRTPAMGSYIKQNIVDPKIAAQASLTMIQRVHNYLTSWWKKPEVDCYKQATYRWNTLPVVKLTSICDDDDSPTTIVVAGYHMPCAFWAPQIMTYHAQAINSYIRENFPDHPKFLCMDGNFMPDSPQYNIMQDNGWVSSAVYSNGTEPAWTTWTHSAFSKKEFKATLDYIWFADLSINHPQLHKSVMIVEFPDFANNTDKMLLPKSDFPSDHLWMSMSIHDKQ